MSNQLYPPKPRPMSVSAFHARFGDETACITFMRAVRWGAALQRFQCPECGGRRGWWLSRRRSVECVECHRQVSVTAGTAFHGMRIPFWKRLWAAYQVAHSKKGVAALSLAKQIAVCYQTAWCLLHKLRQAMREDVNRSLIGGIVEIEPVTMSFDRGDGGTESSREPVNLAMAVELHEGRPGRIASRTLSKLDGHNLRRFTKATVHPGASLRSGDWVRGKLVRRAGYMGLGGRAKVGRARRWSRIFTSNLCRMIQGTHHAVDARHADRYLAEFVYRANHRHCESELFDLIVGAVTRATPCCYKDLITGPKLITPAAA